MNKRQRTLVRKLIREYDDTYVEEGMRSRVDSYQSDARFEAGEKLDLARSLLGFRSVGALRKAAGMPKDKNTDW